MPIFDCILINDEAIQLQVLTMLLENQGLKIKAYHSSETFLRDLKQDKVRFRLAITDFYMPVYSGSEVVQAIRENLGTRTPVIVTSSSLNLPDDAMFATDHCVHPIIPLHPENLVSQTKILLDDPATEYTSCLQTLHKILDLEPEQSLQKLIQTFTSEAIAKQEQLASAQAQQAINPIQSILHSLKGSSGMLGLNSLQRSCEKLEELLKNHDHWSQEYDRMLDHLQQQLETSVDQLQQAGLNFEASC